MDLHESIDRILDSDVVLGEAFYEDFMSKYPAVRKYFEGVNLQRQAVLLTMALLVVEQYEQSGNPAMSAYLRDLGEKHRQWNIPDEMYPYFRDSLLRTLEKFHGPEWTVELAAEWATAIERTTEEMLRGFDDDK